MAKKEKTKTKRTIEIRKLGRFETNAQLDKSMTCGLSRTKGTRTIQYINVG